MNLTDLLKSVQYDIPGVPQPLLLQTARQIVQEWCQHTRMLTHEFGPVNIVAFQSTYPFAYNDGAGMSTTTIGFKYIEVNGYKISPMLVETAYDADKFYRNRYNTGGPFTYLQEDEGVLEISPMPTATILGTAGGPVDGPWAAGAIVPAKTNVYDSNGNQQYSALGGTSGAIAPVWSTVLGGVTTDNTVSWVNMGPEPITTPTGLNRVTGILMPDANATTIDARLLEWSPWLQDGIRANLKAYLRPNIRDMAPMFETRYSRKKNFCRIRAIGDQGVAPQIAAARLPGSV